MIEPETKPGAEMDEFTDDLSDEALDRGYGRWCFHTLCGNPTSVCDIEKIDDHCERTI